MGMKLGIGYDDEDVYDGLLGKYGHDPALDHYSSAQFSRFAYDSNDEEEKDGSDEFCIGIEQEEQLYAEAYKARAFYNGLHDLSGEQRLAQQEPPTTTYSVLREV